MGAHRAASRARGHRSASCMRLERLHGTPPFPLRTAGALNLPPLVCASCLCVLRRDRPAVGVGVYGYPSPSRHM
ncbi:hypothetical protein RSOL_422960 [Rhizoctonia solani AG-3 Rhs1AP]|uniref:Uncharacterized protein n=1 Tax=Rhizoctonia solani AG-3 Rhs1AP TaxID=1086054 RepID=X8JGW0_9AGAM|nr:hypothetical protein RSOL_422960 [Rhizoctonia solani AG-3 Rhs1AP]